MEKSKLIDRYDFEKQVSLSIDAIKSLKKEKAYKTHLPNFPIHKSIATSSKKNKGDFKVKFFVDGIFDYKYMQDFKKFGINEKITFDNDGRISCINANSTTKTSVTLSSPKVISISVDNFQQLNDEDYNGKILRLIVPTELEAEFGVFSCKSIHISGCTTFCGLLEIVVNNKNYHLFKHKNDDTDESYLIIDSLENNDFEEFKTNTSAILLAFGFITGNLFQDDYYYQIIKEDNVIIAEATAYYKKEPSIITHVSLFNPMDFRDYLKHFGQEKALDKMSLQLKPEVFSRMCDLIIKNVTLARSIKLILVGNQTKLLLLKAGIYSIALETITGFISKENKEKLKPITDKKLSDLMIDKFNKILSEYEGFISDYGNEILKAKIDNINSPTNSKKLSKPFEILNLKLTKSELLVLNHRNKFLHGTSPFKETDLENKENDIAYISKKLLTLCNSLILKYCGYSGHLTDYGGFHQLNWEDKVTEHLFKVI